MKEFFQKASKDSDYLIAWLDFRQKKKKIFEREFVEKAKFIKKRKY